MARSTRLAAPALAAAFTPLLAGCYLDPTVVGTPRTPIERALAFCGEKTEAAETQCVHKALAEGKMTVPALVASIPGCKLGTVCNLTYTTRDRAGLLAATATDFVFQWRVTFDLKTPGVSAAAVPVTVTQV